MGGDGNPSPPLRILEMFSLAVVDAYSSRAAEGEQQYAAKNHDDLAVAGLGDVVLTVLRGFPLSDVGHVLGHGVSDLGGPTGEGVALTGGLAIELGGIGARLKILVDLILERLALHAVGVGNGVELLPLGGVGHVLGHGLGDFGFPTDELVALTSGILRAEGGGAGAVGDVFVDDIREDFFAFHTIGVSNGEKLALDVEGDAGLRSRPLLTIPGQLNGLAVTVIKGVGANILFCVVLGNVILCVYGEDAGVRSSLALGVGDVVSVFDERVGLVVVRGGGRAVHLRVDAQPLQFIVGGLFGGALDVEGDGQFGLRDPLFAIPLQLDGLLSLLADDQRMGLAKITAVLLDDLGRLDGDGAGVALGGGTGDVADGVLTLRRLVVLRPVIDVLVVADDPHASADRALDVLLAGLLGGGTGYGR